MKTILLERKNLFESVGILKTLEKQGRSDFIPITRDERERRVRPQMTPIQGFVKCQDEKARSSDQSPLSGHVFFLQPLEAFLARTKASLFCSMHLKADPKAC